MLRSLHQGLKREAGTQLMQNTENFIMLCFVCSQLSAGQGNTHHVLDHVWCIHEASGVLQKVSFKNNLQWRRWELFIPMWNASWYLLSHILEIRCLSGKYSTISNILRIGHVALMSLGSQSEETLLLSSPSQGASKLVVRRCWLSLCTVWPLHSQWLNEQIGKSASSFN